MSADYKTPLKTSSVDWRLSLLGVPACRGGTPILSTSQVWYRLPGRALTLQPRAPIEWLGPAPVGGPGHRRGLKTNV